MVKPELIKEGRFDEVARLAREAVYGMHGFELVHLGVNCTDGEEALGSAQKLARVFGMAVKDGNSSVFAGKGFEFMKTVYLGEKGHVAVGCNDVARALAFLKSRGVNSLPETEKKKDGKTAAIYLDLTIGGFVFHLIQK